MPVYVSNAAAIGAQTPTITLSKSSTTIAAGSSETITATTTPNAFVVTWASSDSTVASVDQSGKITGVAAGTATITATITVDGSTYTATCDVTITA
jgi:internalin A